MTFIRPSRLALAGAVAIAGTAAFAAQTTPTPMATPASTATPMAAATPAPNPSVGGAPMLADKTIVDNASAAPNLTTLVSAVKAAGLVATLAGPGPFTVFAPTNEAFGRLAPGTVDTLMKPEQKPSLTKVLTYHVVAGTISSADLKQRIAAGGGTATLTTVEGDPLKAMLESGTIVLLDTKGNKSYIETPDVQQSNGIVHVVNGVLVPTLG